MPTKKRVAEDTFTFELTLENLAAFMTVKSAIERPCPFCAAKPNRGCTTFGGRKRKIFHKQRFRP
jgi:hypothetical protein